VTVAAIAKFLAVVVARLVAPFPAAVLVVARAALRFGTGLAYLAEG